VDLGFWEACPYATCIYITHIVCREVIKGRPLTGGPGLLQGGGLQHPRDRVNVRGIRQQVAAGAPGPEVPAAVRNRRPAMACAGSQEGCRGQGQNLALPWAEQAAAAAPVCIKCRQQGGMPWFGYSPLSL
jgi:hypothetical protein